MAYFHTYVVDGYDISAEAEGQNITIRIKHPDRHQYRAEYVFYDDLVMKREFGRLIHHIGCRIFAEHVMALAPELFADNREEYITLMWYLPVFNTYICLGAIIIERYHEIPITEADV